MSKLAIKLSYKNCCILKHALRDRIAEKLVTIEIVDNYIYGGSYSMDMNDKQFLKELEEEKLCLSIFSKLINELIDKERSESNSSRKSL